MVLNIDLNSLPFEGSSASGELDQGLFVSPIDVEETDDDVVLLSSSAAFPRRRNRPKRNRQMTIDLEQAIEAPSAQSGASMAEPAAAILLALKSDCCNDKTIRRSYFDLDDDDWIKWQKKSAKTRHMSPPREVITSILLPPPNDPILSCPLCMDKLTNPCSTNCGHIFCKRCIEASIAVSVKNKTGRQCPTCRSKLPVKKSFHRIYLPIDY